MSSREISNVWDDPILFSHPRSGQHFSLCGFALLYSVYSSKIKTVAPSRHQLPMQVLPSTDLCLWEEQEILEEGLSRAELGSLCCQKSLSSLQEKPFDSESTMLWILLSQSKGGSSIHWVTCTWTSCRLWECNVLMLAEGWIKLLCRIFQKWWV